MPSHTSSDATARPKPEQINGMYDAIDGGRQSALFNDTIMTPGSNTSTVDDDTLHLDHKIDRKSKFYYFFISSCPWAGMYLPILCAEISIF